MLRLKRLCALCLAALALCALSLPAFAHPVPDLSKKGAITVTMRYNEQAVPGGALTLYRVGDVREDDGNYSFALTDEFAASGADLAELGSNAAGLARTLADYAAAQSLPGQATQSSIGQDGTAEFADLEPGLYLLVQTEAASGYNAASPFLVSVPMLEEDEYIYEVDAAPKVELTPAPTPTPTPTPNIPFIPIIPIIPFWPTPTPTPVVTPVVTPEVPTEPGVVVEIEPTPTPAPVPEEPAVPTLPQTGQLNWPVPVLAGAGLALFAAGWVLRYGKKDDDAQ